MLKLIINVCIEKSRRCCKVFASVREDNPQALVIASIEAKPFNNMHTLALCASRDMGR